MDAQVEEFGADRLAAIGDALTARCPLVYDEAFVALAAHADVLALCRELLGDYIVLMQQNGVINPPASTHAAVVSPRPAVSALRVEPAARDQRAVLHRSVPVETGATTVIPGSHRMEAFPSDERRRGARYRRSPPSRARSSCSTRCCSTAPGANRSDRPRRAVNQVYSRADHRPADLACRCAAAALRVDPALARLLDTMWRRRDR